MAKLGLSSPWVIFYREIEAMFNEDPEVHVIYDEEANDVTLYVDNEVKAEALSQILPQEKQFGNVTLRITVVPSNNAGLKHSSLMLDAFDGNGALSYIKNVSGIILTDICYVVFKNKVVQFFNDSLSDVNGFCSTLYQNIAEDIFENVTGVYYCTDVPHPEVKGLSLGIPLGEWP